MNLIHDFTDECECPCCHGTRLKPEALESKIEGYSIWDMGQMEVTELIAVLQNIADPGTKRAAKEAGCPAEGYREYRTGVSESEPRRQYTVGW